MPAAQGERLDGRQGGFALIVVLWIVTLLALEVGLFNLSIRDAGALASNELAIARGEALASAGVELAAERLMKADPERKWAADDPPYEVRFGGALIAIKISDEAGRLDINAMDKDLADALLRRFGSSAEALSQWTKTHGPFLDTAGLARALGQPAGELRAMAPHLTVYGGDGKLNPLVASREALLMLPGANAAQVDVAMALRARGARAEDVAQALRPLDKWLGNRTGPAYRIEVAVRGESVPAIGWAEAVIKMGKDATAPYRVLGWRYEPRESQAFEEGSGQ